MALRAACSGRVFLLCLALTQTVAGQQQATSRPTALERPAEAQFHRVLRLLDDRADPAGAALGQGPTVICFTSDDWLYTVDIAGNQCLRPGRVQDQRTLLSLRKALAQDTGVLAKSTPPPISGAPVRPILREVAGDKADSLDVVCSLREQLIVRDTRHGKVSRTWSRGLLRFADSRNRSYAQIVLDSEGRPIRIDTNVHSAALDRLVKALREAVDTERPPLFPMEGVQVGAFYDPSEHRFEISSWSYLGEAFLKPGRRSNPFPRDRYDVQHGHLVDTAAYRRSSDYHHWCWHWWNLYGQLGAAGANKAPIELQSYGLVGGEPVARKTIRQSDGKEYEYPFAADALIESRFYEDLEQLHVVVLNTHGGRWHERFRFRRGLDTWVVLNPGAKRLGHGRLRHLFLEGCAGMTHARDPAPLLEPFWMSGEVVDGMRTICGADGEYVALDRTGWRFFGWYHRGDSVSEAWTRALLDECPRNTPATVAFGPTREEALTTLLTGRFDTERAKPNWVAASVWIRAKQE